MEPESKITSINWLQSSVIILSYEDGNIEFVSITNSDDLQLTSINPYVINKYKLHDGAIKSISFNKDRTKMVSASIDKTSKIFDLEKREVELTITNNVPINSACFSPIKNVIMIGGGLDAMSVAFSSNNDLSIKFCSMRKGKPIGEINTHFGPIRHIEFNPNGKNFASSGQDGYVKIYSLCTEYVGNIELPKFDVNDCVINMKLNNVSNNQLINEVIKYIDYNINTSTKPVKTDEKKSVGTYNVTNIAPVTSNTGTTEPVGATGAYNLKKVFEKYSSNVVEGGIKISNLPNTTTRNDLEEMFELYGRIKERGIYIKNYNDDTIAYINYEDIESAKKAVSAMNGARYEYLVLHVELLLK
jgi:WD40 repeat protein